MSKRTVSFHIVSVVLIVLSALIGVLFCLDSYIRFGLAVQSFGLSMGFFFCKLFGISPSFDVRANKLPSTPPVEILPSTPDGFEIRFRRFGTLFVDGANVEAYFGAFGRFLYYILIALAVLLFFALLFRLVFAVSGRRVVTGRLTESRPLRAYKRIVTVCVTPTVAYVKDCIEFVRARREYSFTLLTVWLFNLNIPTIAFGAFAWLFYFLVSGDFISIYTNLVRLASDLKRTFSVLPLWVWVIVWLIVFDVACRRIAENRLRSMESVNCTLLDELPICTMLVGTMGTGKTLLLTDMTLSRQAMFRDRSRDKLVELQMQFSSFRWQLFEIEISAGIINKTLYNLASCRKFVRDRYREWEKADKDMKLLYGYDGPMTYDDGLSRRGLWEVLMSYVQLFYIYTVASTVIASNYSIRDDSKLIDLGNFPMWDSDFIARTADDVDESIYSHILDFDAFRLGKKVKKNNPHSGSFEFGVVAITEVGKERGNRFDTDGLKKDDERANRVNDGFNRWLKMCRHSSTVEFFPYISVYMDDQRPESLGSDARELCIIVYIDPDIDRDNAIPFYWAREWLYRRLYERLAALYTDHRVRRSDRTLRSHIIHSLAAALYRRHCRTDNKYGYRRYTLGLEAGTQDGPLRTRPYYLVHKKTLAKRYDTACFADIFARQAMKTSGGVDKYPEYKKVRASVTEMLGQQSYFVDELIKGGDG